MTESPLRNILGINLLLVTAAPFLPFLGISVHSSWTFSMTMFMWRSKALTFPRSFLLLRRAMRTSLLALTDLVSNENGPTLKLSYCTLLVFSSISYNNYYPNHKPFSPITFSKGRIFQNLSFIFLILDNFRYETIKSASLWFDLRLKQTRHKIYWFSKLWFLRASLGKPWAGHRSSISLIFYGSSEVLLSSV